MAIPVSHLLLVVNPLYLVLSSHQFPYSYKMKIGVFDSGIGGMTVLKELVRRYPHHHYIYFGDNANVPYGTKSPETIRALCRAGALKLQKLKVDAVIVACNTASSLALATFKKTLKNIPVFDVLEAGADYACQWTARSHQKSKILVLATHATVASRAYQKTIRKKGFKGSVLEKACPLFVPIIEEGIFHDRVLREAIDRYVSALKTLPHNTQGIVLLGCTHYPWIEKELIQAFPHWKVLNSAKAMALSLKKTLLAPSKKKGKIQWIFTDPKALSKFALKAMSEI